MKVVNIVILFATIVNLVTSCLFWQRENTITGNIDRERSFG